MRRMRFGIYGTSGQGLAHEYGINDKVEIQMGTFSKAAGSSGGYIAGKEELIEYLIQRSRAFIYSTAPAIPDIAASIKAIEIIENGEDLRAGLHKNIDYLNKGLSSIKNIDATSSNSAIFSIKFEEIKQALEISRKLYNDHDIKAFAIRPPTVKTPRIRLCVNVLHTERDLEYLLKSLLLCI